MSDSGDGSRDRRITIRAVLIGLALIAYFSFITVREAWRHGHYTVTQIPVLPFAALLFCVVLVNPILRRIRLIRPFGRGELMAIFSMGLVSAGIATIGLAAHMVPVMSGLFGPANNEQSRWDLYIEPYVNEGYFLAEPGTQLAAIRLRDADAAWRAAQQIDRAARFLQSARQETAAAEAALAAVRAAPPSDRQRTDEVLANRRLAAARITLKQSEEWWRPYEGTYRVDEAVAAFPAKVAALRATMEERKKELDAIEAPAFERVKEFRDGLPKEMRAFPGFMPIDGWPEYLPIEPIDPMSGWSRLRNFRHCSARFYRLIHGTSALRALQQADALLDGEPSGPETRDRFLAYLKTALERLAKVDTAADLAKRVERIEEEIEANKTVIEEEREKSRLLHRRRRYASAEEFDAIDAAIAEVVKRSAERTAENRALTFTLTTEVKREVDVAERLAETRKALDALRARLEEDPSLAPVAVRAEMREQMAAFRSFDASWERFLIGDIPWRHWLRPLFNWALIIFTAYMVLMTFNVLIFRQWAHNEKLIYPLAELPCLLTGDGETGRVPALFRSGLFWTGFGIVAFFVGWNDYVVRYVPGMSPIPLEWEFTEYVRGSFLAGLAPHKRVKIFFALIGITFLIPSRISFSLWFFAFVQMFQILVLVWLGYGVDESSFGTDDRMVLNFTTAQGGGALIIFASVVLWRCRKYILCAFRAKSLEGLESGERRELRLASALFLAGSALFILLLNRGFGASLFYSILYYLIIMVITIGLLRAVAECGLLGFNCWFGPFHFIRTVFGMNHAWSAPTLFAPLFIFHSTLFMAYRVCIAPAMANALKIRDTIGLKRLSFHAVLALGIAAGFFVGVYCHIAISYNRGAPAIHTWYYNGIPPHVFNTIRTMAMTNPVDSTGGRWWLGAGAVSMALLLYLRSFCFWLPHPIGLVMFVNPMMNSYWFSIFLGWMFKVLVTKYGNKDTYTRMRCLFIGLVVAEVLLCLSGRPLDTPHIWAQY